MVDEKKRGFDFGSVGVGLGLLAIMCTVIVLAVMSCIRAERSEEITWVG